MQEICKNFTQNALTTYYNTHWFRKASRKYTSARSWYERTLLYYERSSRKYARTTPWYARTSIK